MEEGRREGKRGKKYKRGKIERGVEKSKMEDERGKEQKRRS
jgi:hypothetical protein